MPQSEPSTFINAVLKSGTDFDIAVLREMIKVIEGTIQTKLKMSFTHGCTCMEER